MSANNFNQFKHSYNSPHTKQAFDFPVSKENSWDHSRPKATTG